MAGETLQEFQQRRAAENERVLSTDNRVIKRVFSLDSQCYRDGALPRKTKELLGLVASMVLRCNDCIDYHLEQCVAIGYDLKEIEDAMSVALVVGGTIVIPHLRHARATLAQLFA